MSLNPYIERQPGDPRVSPAVIRATDVAIAAQQAGRRPVDALTVHDLEARIREAEGQMARFGYAGMLREGFLDVMKDMQPELLPSGVGGMSIRLTDLLPLVALLAVLLLGAHLDQAWCLQGAC